MSFSWIELLSVKEIELLALIEIEKTWIELLSGNEIELLESLAGTNKKQSRF